MAGDRLCSGNDHNVPISCRARIYRGVLQRTDFFDE